jgi:hypothetical protein
LDFWLNGGVVDSFLTIINLWITSLNPMTWEVQYFVKFSILGVLGALFTNTISKWQAWSEIKMYIPSSSWQVFVYELSFNPSKTSWSWSN